MKLNDLARQIVRLGVGQNIYLKKILRDNQLRYVRMIILCNILM